MENNRFYLSLLGVGRSRIDQHDGGPKSQDSFERKLR